MTPETNFSGIFTYMDQIWSIYMTSVGSEVNLKKLSVFRIFQKTTIPPNVAVSRKFNAGTRYLAVIRRNGRAFTMSKLGTNFRLVDLLQGLKFRVNFRKNTIF
jgi:hypothetical protein